LKLALVGAIIILPFFARAQPRVAILGDSITYAGRWTVLVESALRATPEFADAEIVNFGLPSETVSGLSEPGHAGGKFPRPDLPERLDRVLDGFKPTLVLACYGMNDGIYLPLDEARFKAFQDGMVKLKSAVEKHGARIICITAPLFKADNLAGDDNHYDAVLDAQAQWLNSRRADGWQVVDIRPELKAAVAEAKRADPKFIYAGDGVHPGNEGHRFIAESVARQLWPLLKLSGEPRSTSGEALKILSQRNELLKLAWLTQTRHLRPGIPAGLPLEQAQAQAAKLLEQYRAAATPARVACVGDSITAGVGTAMPALDAYPVQLQRMLGDGWQVRNFGNSGSTLLNHGDKPYQKQRTFQDALDFKPEIVVIMLGANDSKPQNWKFKDEFSADYRELVEKFKALPSQPKMFLCRPAFVPGAGNYGINDPVVREEIVLIDAVAKSEDASVIDVHAATLDQNQLFPDRVHPNTEGANVMARTVFESLTGKKFAGELGPLKSRWNGFEKLEFAVDGRAALLVKPKTPAPGNPWIWRTEFFGHEPQADLALLAKGWHVAYVNVENMYGAPVALDHMDKFYDRLQTEFQLAPKVVLEGFSRGGLFAFNWAARHPANVAGMYVDAPVCDFKSWPGGKGVGPGSPDDWKNLLKVYGFTEAQALAYDKNPVDNLAPLAQAHIPIFAVIGAADEVVPVSENIDLVEKRYQALGGKIEIIRKPGGKHHPHSLKDPTPIVDFVVAISRGEK
jgi:lysophospholipase L1-like esterase/pimeloyl-ACP methyl ester carboxylesterase